jgi:hypothetical protein
MARLLCSVSLHYYHIMYIFASSFSHTTQHNTHTRVHFILYEFQEGVSGNKGKPHPAYWEHAHNHCVMAFRLYYRGDRLDPSFPAAVPPREIVVPAEKPKPDSSAPYYIQMNNKKTGAVAGASAPGADPNQDDGDEPHLDMAALIGGDPNEERRQVLREVRGEN